MHEIKLDLNINKLKDIAVEMMDKCENIVSKEDYITGRFG